MTCENCSCGKGSCSEEVTECEILEINSWAKVVTEGGVKHLVQRRFHSRLHGYFVEVACKNWRMFHWVHRDDWGWVCVEGRLLERPREKHIPPGVLNVAMKFLAECKGGK